MLASLAFPYTLDTGETITEGMGMECLTGDTHTPRTVPPAPPVTIWFWLSLRHHDKTRGGSTIARCILPKVAYFHTNILKQIQG